MENFLNLDQLSKKELRKRGFFVIENFTFLHFFKSLISIPIISGFINGVIYLMILVFLYIGLITDEKHIFYLWEYSRYIGVFLGSILTLYSIYSYTISSKIFFTPKGTLGFGILTDKGKINIYNENISISSNILGGIWSIINYVGDIGFGREKQGLFLVVILIIASFFGLYQIGAILGIKIPFENFAFKTFGGDILLQILSVFIPILGISIFGKILNFLVNNFHPLYAFGNLGSRIQSLTPRIFLQSEKIEKEFSSDMNFHILSDSFDTLSSDFQKIIGYVLKLEQIEKKANTGNLFDSTKYINSLREDITKPLISLKSFLEKQKEALEHSQEELKNITQSKEITKPQEKVRVRAGGVSQGNQSTQPNPRTELTGNAELSSKRAEPLLQELTENIEKLEVMVGKFGR